MPLRELSFGWWSVNCQAAKTKLSCLWSPELHSAALLAAFNLIGNEHGEPTEPGSVLI